MKHNQVWYHQTFEWIYLVIELKKSFLFINGESEGRVSKQSGLSDNWILLGEL
jgi:hypothetical protein